jgi:Fe-S oxidoreductase
MLITTDASIFEINPDKVIYPSTRNVGCCGMAGEFGYKHPKLSKNIAHQSLNELIESIDNNAILIATGVSCRKQILDIFKIQPIPIPRLFIQSLLVE